MSKPTSVTVYPTTLRRLKGYLTPRIRSMDAVINDLLDHASVVPYAHAPRRAGRPPSSAGPIHRRRSPA
jgi:hypothetical protein